MDCKEPKKDRRGRRPGAEIYRRLTLPLTDEQQQAIAAWVLDQAAAIRGEEQGACGIEYLAFLAASTQHATLFKGLIGRTDTSDGHVEYDPAHLLTEDDVDLLERFWDVVTDLRAKGRKSHPRYFGPRQRIIHQRWIQDETGRDTRDIRRADKNAFRFLERLRTNPDGDKPELFRDLPSFLPWWQRPTVQRAAPVAAVLLLIATAALMWLHPRRSDAKESTIDRTRAGMFAVVNLGDGVRVIEGFPDGHWRITRPDGTVEYEAPASLRLGNWVEGGTAGDLTGDGQPELVLFSSASIHASQLKTGVHVFSRRGGGWRRLATLPTHEVGEDPDDCARVRTELESGAKLTPELERRRELCPSLVADVRVHDGALLILQSHYGRQLLRSRCTNSGCSSPRPVLSVRADLTSSISVRDGAGRSRFVLATGCWQENGPLAYGLLVGDAAATAKSIEFTKLGGRSFVVALDDTHFAALSGTECEKLTERALVADNRRAPPVTPANRRIVIGHLDRNGALVTDQAVPFDDCCREGARLVVLEDRPHRARRLVVIHSAGGEAWRLSAFDLSKPLAAQRPVVSTPVKLGRPTSAVAVDVDGDGIDELLIGATQRGFVAHVSASGWHVLEPAR